MRPLCKAIIVFCGLLLLRAHSYPPAARWMPAWRSSRSTGVAETAAAVGGGGLDCRDH